MLKKLSNKLILAYITLIIILAITVFALLANLLKTTHINIIKTEMGRYGELICLEFKDSGIKPVPSSSLSKTVSDMAKIMELRITIVKTDGYVIADSEVKDLLRLENHQYRKEIIDALATGSGYSTRYSQTIGTDMLYFAKFNGHYIIRLAKSLHEVDRSLVSLRKIILNVSFFVLAASIIIIVIISIKVTKPFKETLSFASEFAQGNYKRRIMNYNSDEIGSLQKALNKMADTLVATLNEHILEQKKLEATLDSISDGIAMIDSSKQIVISNKSFLCMLGINSDPRGRQYYEIIRNSSLNSGIEKGLKSGEKDFFEIETGSGRFFEIIINPIRGEEIIEGILLTLHDISEKREIEKIKSDLVSNVSHELKTPIAIIKGYLETIKENYSNRELSMTFIERAIDNVDRQNALIQDIIKLSLIESSKEFESETIDLKSIIEKCIDLLTPKIMKKEIALTIDLGSRSEYNTTGNLFLAEEIFFNIIDNGINYNNHGGKLSVKSSESADSFQFEIADTGIGIPPDSIDRIFERFYRVDRSRSRATGGTGLGLSIVKHAAIFLGWDISVKSGNKGTIFIISVKKDSLDK